MKLSVRTEYALLALIHLARQKEDGPAHGQEIADAQNIPMRFLQQILYSLKQARIVKSLKGRDGGYSLAKDPTKISIAEIVRLFDGPLAPSKSVSKFFHEDTPIIKEKKMTAILKEVRDYISERLEKTYLSDLI